MKPIALDAMGGDNMPRAAVRGAAKAKRSGLDVILVGDRARLESELAALDLALDIHHAADVFGMTEHASEVRRRKDSSIMQALALVKEGRASACVSMGHSGATMAAALLSLGRIKGVDRPAIIANIPSEGGFTALLDAGANADCRPAYLQQFAIMGRAYAQTFYGHANPKVGLMSIGEEDHKGNELTLAAHALLKTTPGLNFYGNVEGRDLMSGVVDVVVTDGFTGNIILKLAEGEAKTLFGWIRQALSGGGVATKLGAALVRPALRRLAARLDPSSYGAQPLLGIAGNVFIGHGSADERAVTSALQTATRAVEADLVAAIRKGLQTLTDMAASAAD